MRKVEVLRDAQSGDVSGQVKRRGHESNETKWGNWLLELSSDGN